MSILVEQQNETIDVIQTAAMSVEKDTEVGCVAFRVISCHSLAFLKRNPGYNTQTRQSLRLGLRAGNDGFVSSLSSSSLQSLASLSASKSRKM